jgi:hypothetical protein
MTDLIEQIRERFEHEEGSLPLVSFRRRQREIADPLDLTKSQAVGGLGAMLD